MYCATMFSLIFVILLMLNANYVARAEGERNPKQLISQLLNEVENRQADVKNILDYSRSVRLRLPRLRKNIASALAKNSLLIEGKNALAEGKANGDNVDKCQALFDLKVEWLVHKIHRYLTDSTKDDLNNFEDIIKLTGEQLNKVKNDLEEIQSSNVNLDSCNDQNSNCEIYDKLATKINESSVMLTEFKTSMSRLEESFLQELENEEAPILVRNNIFLPVIECL